MTSLADSSKSLRETKDLLMDFYQSHRGEAIYPDDIACELGLDLKIAMQAIKELIYEGRLEEGTCKTDGVP